LRLRRIEVGKRERGLEDEKVRKLEDKRMRRCEDGHTAVGGRIIILNV